MISRTNHPPGANSGSHPKAFLAHSFMATDDQKKGFMKRNWSKGGDKPALFQPKEIDLFVDKTTLEAFIFHGKQIDYDNIERLEYNPEDYTVEVIMKDGTLYDLGVKIQWLLRPYFTKAREVMIVQTKDGKSIDGRLVPFIHKEKKETKQ
jgi:hypothetical protein